MCVGPYRTPSEASLMTPDHVYSDVQVDSDDDTYSNVYPYSKEVLDNRKEGKFPVMFRSCSETMEE